VRVAVIHEWLSTYGGSERVTKEFLDLYPDADLFTLVDFFPEEFRSFLRGRRITCSFIQRLPFARKQFRWYLPLMPLAVEQFDLSDYDLVISSSHAMAKGVITRPHQCHVSYVHSPMRYAWDLENGYLEAAGFHGIKAMGARSLMHYMRMWDTRTANGVDQFVANSRFVARRVRKAYGRNSIVVHPPVDVDSFQVKENKEDYYVTVSRLVSYKRIDLLVDAFAAMPAKRLIVVGDGPEMPRIKARANRNVEIMGHQSFTAMRDLVAGARGFVFAAEEDFGLAPVEAQACGTPVIAYGRGGVRDTVLPEETGIFFDRQTPDALIAAVDRFETMEFQPRRLRLNAERFSATRFRREFQRAVGETLEHIDSTTAIGTQEFEAVVFDKDRAAPSVEEVARHYQMRLG
jgi:glycosyltransferase involved in cell wall biosynthesis